MTLGCRCRLLLAALLVSASAAVAYAAPSYAATPPADRLVLQAGEVPGLAAGRASLGDARAVLARALGDGEAAGATPSRVEAASYADGSAPRPRLDVRAYAFRTTRAASAAMAAWRRSERRAGHAPVEVAVGARAFVTARRAAGRAHVVIVLRSGNVVAQVRYRAAIDLKIARETALGYARLEATRLTSVANRTVADRVLDGVRPDGTLPPRTLLQLVALLYGPVDGVTLPAGRPGPSMVDATTVLQELRENAAALSPAQREAVERAVALPAPAGTPSTPSAMRRTKAGDCQPSIDGNPFDATASAEYDRYRDMIAARIVGLGFAPAWQTCVYAWRTPDGEAGADTTQWLTSLTSSPYDLIPGFLDTIELARRGHDMCFVRRFPLLDDVTPQNRAMSMAHEAFHCLEREWIATNGGARNALWAEEGMASWAGHQVQPATYEPSDRIPGIIFRRWMQVWGGYSLFEREHPAWGFFGVVEGVAGPDALWSRVVPIWRAGANNEAAWAAAVGSQEGDVLDTWGAGLFREASFPAAWQQRLPFAIPDTRGADYNKPTLTLGPAGTAREETLPYRADMWVVRSPASPLVKVTIVGHGRVTDGHTDWRLPSEQWFCFGGRCVCPPGTIALTTIPHHDDIDGALYAGVASGATRSALVLEAHDMSEYCSGSTPPDGDPGGGGRGTSHSEPHIITFDSLYYDLQAAGEFVLARSADGAFEVQARQQVVDDIGLATTNTAVAMRADGHRLAIYGRPQTVRIDGRVQPMARDDVLAVGAVQLRRAGPLYYVQWPDGSQVRVDTYEADALRVTVEPAATLAVRGVFGSNDGDPANDLVTSGGARLDYTLPAGGAPYLARYGSGVDGFEWLHGPFADSWRVRAATSLFDYAPGQSPATFVDRSVPRREFTLADFTAAQRRRAKRACAAIADALTRRNCERDVALTGDAGFAATAQRAERDRYGWRPLTGFESRVGPLSVLADNDGSTYFAAQNAIFGVETLATLVTVPSGSLPLAPALLERGLVHDPFLYRAADGTVEATLPVDDLLTGLGAVRVFRLAPTGGSTPAAAAASSSRAPSGPAPGAATAAGSAIVVSGPTGIELYAGGTRTAPAALRPSDGTDCAALAPSLAAAGGRMWLAWSAALCAPSGPRVVPVDPLTGAAAGEVRQAPGALPNLLFPTQLVTSLAVRPDGVAVMAYPGEERVLAWHADDDAEPIVLGRTPGATTDTVLVAAEPTSGRIWVAWREPNKRTLQVRRSEPDGRTFGPVRSLEPPFGLPDRDRRGGDWVLGAADGRLVVGFGVRALSTDPGSAWYTTLR